MPKRALTAAIAEGCELKWATAAQVISTLASFGTEEKMENGNLVKMKVAYPNMLFDRNIIDGRAMLCAC